MTITHQKIKSKSQLERVIDSDKLDQIIAAIIAGKYSWACVLILRFAGYNPLQYIPYRTYNRLIKKNSHSLQTHYSDTESLGVEESEQSNSSQSAYQISDLSYLEAVNGQDKPVRGGMRIVPTDEYLSIKDLELGWRTLAA